MEPGCERVENLWVRSYETEVGLSPNSGTESTLMICSLEQLIKIPVALSGRIELIERFSKYNHGTRDEVGQMWAKAQVPSTLSGYQTSRVDDIPLLISMTTTYGLERLDER